MGRHFLRRVDRTRLRRAVLLRRPAMAPCGPIAPSELWTRDAAGAYRAAFTADFSHLQPVRDPGQLADLGWLGQPGP
jgi:hypothetical protein